MSINKLTLTGNVGEDPKVNTTASGSRRIEFSLATNESWIDKNTGDKKQHTDWHSCVGYQHLVDIIDGSVKKGQKITLIGKVQYFSYKDEMQNDHKATRIRIEEIEF